MRAPSPVTVVLAIVTVALAGLVVGRVSAQADDSPTDHPPIVVPRSSVTPSPSPTTSPSVDRDHDDDDDDDYRRITPRPRDIDDDDDDDDHRGRDHPEDD